MVLEPDCSLGDRTSPEVQLLAPSHSPKRLECGDPANGIKEEEVTEGMKRRRCEKGREADDRMRVARGGKSEFWARGDEAECSKIDT